MDTERPRARCEAGPFRGDLLARKGYDILSLPSLASLKFAHGVCARTVQLLLQDKALVRGEVENHVAFYAGDGQHDGFAALVSLGGRLIGSYHKHIWPFRWKGWNRAGIEGATSSRPALASCRGETICLTQLG